MKSDWIYRRYKVLLESFGEREFRFEDAVRVLSSMPKEDGKPSHVPKEQVNVILSELRKNGLLEVKFDEQDARKKIYKLRKMEDFMEKEIPERLTRADLESLLKSAADIIRTRVDYSFILILLFYKRICDKWEMEYQDEYRKALEDGLTEEEAKEEAKNASYHDFDIPEEYLWENIRKDTENLTEKFSKALKVIAERNPELKDVFENVDFIQFTASRENTEILRKLIELFSAKPLYHVSPDILGDAYEWILRFFAPQKAKEGEVYTPREVIKLIIEILKPKPEESVYDPACGSGGMLISAYQYVRDKFGKDAVEKLFLYGQEVNYKTLALAKMNLYIHDIRNAEILYGDTLLYPKFKDGNELKRFDVVIANPPWNQDQYDEEQLKKGEFYRERFQFGFTPNQSADWAWIQHMIYSAKNNGRIGIVIDNGCLFRGGKERAIREGIIKKDLLECVILLPEKLFYNTGAPGAILIFSKNKKDERKRKILFINAGNEFIQHPEIRKLNMLSDENIMKIVKVSDEFSEEEGFSRIVDIEEIQKNEFNLNVTLYVYPEEKEEEIDVGKEWEELGKIENEISILKEKIKNYLKELGY